MSGGSIFNLCPGWTLIDEEGGSGTWYSQTGTSTPLVPGLEICIADVQPPPDGMFAALTDPRAKGSHVMYQDVTIPAGSNPVLSFQFFMGSATTFYTPSPNSLSIQAGQPNQQFRVDTIDPASNVFTLDALQGVL